MANEKNDPNKPAGAAASPQKRPNTIDLTATEIKPEPSAKPASAAKVEPAAKPEPATEPVAKPEPAVKPEPAKQAEAPVAAPPPPRPAETAKAAPQNTSRATGAVPPPGDHRAAEAKSTKGLPWPVIGIALAAAVIFFAIGIGAGQWLSSRAPQPAALVPQPVAATLPPELQARIDKLEAQLATVPKDDPQLQARLAKLEAQLSAPRASDQQLVARIAGAEAAVKTLADLTASREKRSDDIAAVAREARDRASSAAAAAETAQKSQAASPEARADLDALNTRIAALEQSMRDSQAELARRLSADDAKGRYAIAAIALRDTVDRGLPFSAELAAVKSLSGDATALAPLETFAASGVPSAGSLGRELAGLVPAIWKVARKDEPQSGSFLERLQSNAEKIVRIRPAGEVAGDDPASIFARIEGRAGNADISGALAELAKLPPEARAPADGWIKKAQARDAAIAAARNISQTALSALVKPGS
jgi:hypothetical protein